MNELPRKLHVIHCSFAGDTAKCGCPIEWNENVWYKASARSSERMKTVLDHKFIATECHTSGCQYLVLTHELEALRAYKKKIDDGFTVAALALSGEVGFQITCEEAWQEFKKAMREAETDYARSKSSGFTP